VDAFLRQVLGVCSFRIFAKNMGDPYYEPTIVVHDTPINSHQVKDNVHEAGVKVAFCKIKYCVIYNVYLYHRTWLNM